jgi:hypothetical protein
MCRLSTNSEASTFWNPKGLSRPVAGKLYLYLYNNTIIITDISIYLIMQGKKVDKQKNMWRKGRSETEQNVWAKAGSVLRLANATPLYPFLWLSLEFFSCLSILNMKKTYFVHSAYSWTKRRLTAKQLCMFDNTKVPWAGFEPTVQVSQWNKSYAP